MISGDTFTAEILQEGEHSPVDDARAALYLYHKHRKVRAGAGCDQCA